MSGEEMEIILDAIDSVSKYHNETQYDCGEKSIDERGIRVLKATVKGLYISDDGCY